MRIYQVSYTGEHFDVANGIVTEKRKVKHIRNPTTAYAHCSFLKRTGLTDASDVSVELLELEPTKDGIVLAMDQVAELASRWVRPKE